MHHDPTAHKHKHCVRAYTITAQEALHSCSELTNGLLNFIVMSAYLLPKVCCSFTSAWFSSARLLLCLRAMLSCYISTLSLLIYIYKQRLFQYSVRPISLLWFFLTILNVGYGCRHAMLSSMVYKAKK